MLEFIRNRAQTWISWVIVALILIPFVLWGIGDYFTGNADSSVAVVNDTKISEQEFRMAYYRQEQRMKEMLGENFDASMFEDQMRKNVLDGLIEQELLVQTSSEAGMRISPEQLAMVIQNIEAFQNNGTFDRGTYESTLKMQGQSTGYFESQVRRSLLTQQLYSGVVDSAIVTDYAVNQLLKLENQEREIGYFEIPAAKFISEVEVSDEQIAENYNQNLDNYITPEKVDVQYLELSVGQLREQISVSEEELQSAYDEQKEGMATPEQRRASHILIEVPYGASDEEKAEAEKEANEVLALLKDGGNFAELAKQHSDDPGSAEQGGDLGLFSKGDMVEEFDAKVFSMNEGEMSDLVATEFGYHIIRLDEIKRSEIPAFDEVREELYGQVQFNKAERLYYDKADTLTNMAFEYPDNLDSAAEELGLTVKKLSGITKSGGPAPFSNPKLTKALFSNEVLEEGLNSEPVEISDNHLIVARVSQHIPSKAKPLEDVGEQIKQQLTRKAAQEMAQLLGERVLASLEEGVSPEELAKENHLAWQEAGLLKRDASGVNRVIVERAFELTRPEEGKSAVGSVTLGNGGYAVVSVSKVVDADITNFTQEDRERMRGQLAGIGGNSDYEAFSESLRDSADVVVKLSE